jgi:tetratricopeptide (TPR) repeat protein/serine phosphatase RsbU (regulator of sigma subunit)
LKIPLNLLVLLLLMLGVFSFSSFSQSTNSNWKYFNDDSKPDSLRFKAIDDLIWDNYLFENPDSAIYFASVSYQFAVKIKNVRLQAVALNTKGTCYYIKDDFKNAIRLYLVSLKRYHKAGNLLGKGTIYNNLGNIYKEQGDLVKAVEYYTLSLRIAEKLDDKSGMASSLNNIGILYAEQDKYYIAIRYYKKSIKIRRAIKDRKGLSAPLNNIGNVLESQKDYFGAIKYYSKSLEIDKEVNNMVGVVTSMGNIAGIYTALIVTDTTKNTKKLDLYYHKSYALSEEILTNARELGDNTIMLTAYLNMSILLELKGKNEKAMYYGNKAYHLAEEIGSVGYIRDAADVLYQALKKKGAYKEALEMFEVAAKMKDSVLSIENTDEIIHQEYKYEYDRQAEKDSILNLHQTKLTAVKFKQERTQRFALFGGLVLVLIFSIFIYKRYKVTFNQKEIISLKEQETNKQKILLELKNKEIMDSITYAKRIQSAILPPAKIVKEYLKDSFILYKPRDIVAGDFYWMEQIQDGLIFAAADCTGHGVPGAMVSVVCNNALNRTVREYGLTEPGKILDKARELIISEFDQSDDDMKDGMDISLCTLEFEPDIMSMGSSADWSSVKLKWAGANNPLWILRDNQIFEYKGNKQPIGYYVDPKPFTTHVIELRPNDIIYVFTDGYQDQFGGDLKYVDGKKYKVSRMKELFLRIAHEPMAIQKELIDKAFEEWKRDLEQVDDVCVIGVKI